MVGATDVDEAAVRMLRRSAKPVLLVANKADNAAIEMESHALWSLGLGQPWAISALHGRGSGDLLDAILDAMPSPAPVEVPLPRGPRRVALVGRPNVGKSSLLNRLAREERAVVDPVAGTTVDPVDSLVELGGETWQLVDTAGLRKRVGQASGTEYYASLRTNAAIEAAEVAVVLLDASEPISEQDQRILSMVTEAGRALVLAFNKWDLVDADRRYYLDREIERELRRIPWAIRRQRVRQDQPGPGQAGARPAYRAGELGEAGTDRPAQPVAHRARPGHAAPVRGGRAPRVLFATQAGTAPPKFVLFTTGALDAGYVAVRRAATCARSSTSPAAPCWSASSPASASPTTAPAADPVASLSCFLRRASLVPASSVSPSLNPAS